MFIHNKHLPKQTADFSLNKSFYRNPFKNEPLTQHLLDKTKITQQIAYDKKCASDPHFSMSTFLTLHYTSKQTSVMPNRPQKQHDSKASILGDNSGHVAPYFILTATCTKQDSLSTQRERESLRVRRPQQEAKW